MSKKFDSTTAMLSDQPTPILDPEVLEAARRVAVELGAGDTELDMLGLAS